MKNRLSPLAFCYTPLDRAEALRRDPSALAALESNPSSQTLLLKRGEPAVTEEGMLYRLPLTQTTTWPQVEQPILLGLQEGKGLYVTDLDPETDFNLPAEFTDARLSAMTMPLEDTGILAQARSLVEWRRKHRYCSNCGSLTHQVEAGRKRACPNCQTEHFPRIDPVAIMLVIKDDWCLLGRQPGWPERMWSALAGFMEPGETIQAACAREILEESGIQADPDTVEIIDNQPWPFPSSLMIGLMIQAVSVDITIDPHELEAARWFSKDEVRAMVNGTHPEADIPPRIAIARRLLEVWVN